jgi:phosphatidylserine/phosphatidylglycerophosphate/cardiolipin synthase-like enzyme
MVMEGDVARALGDYGRERWAQAGGEPMEPCPPCDVSPWPEALRAEFNDVEVGLSRTRAAYNDIPEAREIEALFIEQIARSKCLIYAESQYFASRAVAEAMALRLSRPDPPEIVVINPETADGWLEQTAMDGARIRLLQAIRDRDHARRFSIWCPYGSKGTPIYVHSKMMIVDDEIIRVGSANFNNRSMGLDSEFDVFIDAARAGNESAGPAIARLRVAMLAEHTGQTPEIIADLLEKNRSMAGMLDALPKGGKCLRRFEPRELTEAEEAIADAEALDPERPEEMLPFYKKRGLFRSRILRRPRKRLS